MEPKDCPEGHDIDFAALASNLNELRDALVMLSTKIKDYKATLDWDRQGEGMQSARDVVTRAAEGAKNPQSGFESS